MSDEGNRAEHARSLLHGRHSRRRGSRIPANCWWRSRAARMSTGVELRRAEADRPRGLDDNVIAVS